MIKLTIALIFSIIAVIILMVAIGMTVFTEIERRRNKNTP